MIRKREPKHMGEVMSDIAERYNKLTKTKMSKSKNDTDQTQELLNQARDLMESFDDCIAMTIGYDKEEYTLTAKQMNLIAGALYLVDCRINQNKDEI